MKGMGMPERVQLSRRKGWRMPENTVKVDRTTKWGNPHRIGTALHECRDAAEAVRKFRLGFADIAKYGFTDSPIGRMFRDLPELRGKNLACWCPLDGPCHADVLLEMANREPEA
jgi:hypothetical protein